MNLSPFGAPGKFYRGNLHMHSTASDGKCAPEVIVNAYRDKGYDFVVLTDHYQAQYGFPITDTRSFHTQHFTTLLGAELHAPGLEAGGLYHLVAVGLPAGFAPTRPQETGPQLAARAADAGAFVGIAHPAGCNMTLDEALAVDAAHAVETYNNANEQLYLRGSSWHLFEQLLLRGRRLYAYAADDAHDIHPLHSFGGWVHVRAPSLAHADLLQALRTGCFYSRHC